MLKKVSEKYSRLYLEKDVFRVFGMLAFDVELMTVSLTNVSVMEGISPDIFSTVCVFKKSISLKHQVNKGA